jgi:CRISPR system Cascade subunit CasE
MDAKQRLHWKTLRPEERPTLNAIAYEAGSTWLVGRAEKHGFTIMPASLMVDGYQTHALHHLGRVPICFSTLDFSGILTVTDTTQFLSTLYNGLGPAKGFGCGLLLIKRA